MKIEIEIDDSLAPKIDIDEKEAMELLAIALYKYKGDLEKSHAQYFSW